MKSKKEPWRIGDVYAHKISSEFAKEYGLNGRYFLLQKLDEYPYSPRIIAPIAYVKITKDETLPTTTEEFNQLEYVQTSFTKYEERFYPLDFRRLEEDIAEKSKLTYTVDEYGYLPEFRVMLVLAAGKCIPPDFVYVGSFPDADPPKIEFIPHLVFNIRMIFCKKNAELLDRILSNAYHGHNRRTLNLYQKEFSSKSQATSDSHTAVAAQGIDGIPEWLRNCINDLKAKGNSEGG